MEHFTLNDPLPNPIAKVLIALVSSAEKNNTLDVPCFVHSTNDGAHYISIGQGKNDEFNLTVPVGNPIVSLQKIGCLEQQENGRVFLLPLAFHRANYERKNRFTKWIARSMENGKDIMLGMSFLLSLLLTIKELFFQ